MRPPRLIKDSPDLFEQIQHHLDLIWKALEDQKGIGGRTVRLLGPLDMMGLPIQGVAPMTPAKHDGSHQWGGSDEIDVTGLSGLLGDTQTPHLMAAATRGGAKLGDVFTLVSEVLTLALKDGFGIIKDTGELALIKQPAVEAVASADATDLATVLTLANEMKEKLNLLIQYLKDAEHLSEWTGYFAEGYFHLNYWANGYFPDAT